MSLQSRLRRRGFSNISKYGGTAGPISSTNATLDRGLPVMMPVKPKKKKAKVWSK